MLSFTDEETEALGEERTFPKPQTSTVALALLGVKHLFENWINDKCSSLHLNFEGVWPL